MNIEINKIIHYFFCKIIPALTILYITRKLYLELDAHDFVRYTILFSTSITLSNLLTGWFGQSNLRFGVNNDKRVDSINSYFMLLCFIFAVLSFLLIFILPNQYENNIVTLLLSLSLALYNILYTYIQSKSKSKSLLKMEMIRSTILLLSFTLLYIVNIKFNILNVLLIYSLSYVVSFLFLFKDYTKWVSCDSCNKFPISYLKKYIAFGLPMSIWMVIATSYPLIERNIINHFFSASISSDYFAISELFNRGIGIIFIPLIMYIHPLLMKVYDNTYLDFNGILIKYIKLELLLGVIGMVCCYLLSSLIIPILLPGLPSDFINHSFLFILPPLLWQIAFLAHKKHEANKKTFRLLITLLISTAVYVSIMFIFLYNFSVFYAIFAQIIALLIYISISLFYKRTYFECNSNC